MRLSDVPQIFQKILLVLTILGIAIFLLNLMFSNASEEEKMEKFTGKMAETAVPTELSWLAKAADKLGNYPLLLLGTIIVIAWLFGHIKFKAR